MEKAVSYITPYTEVNYRWIKDFKTKGKTINLTEENLGEYFCDLGVGFS